ncbi:hypothetical protein [Salinigranum halophilum]|uniref:hypothetical protein n=1 Tax=Salinigranum halophilum TaxID=2565931 RepID=UPI00115E3462|nr:hypothetical protein [Salinigranum halophilum]
MSHRSPLPSRRGFLALTTAALAGLSGCASVPNGPLPPVVVRARTRTIPVPPVEPTVPVLESHVDAYRARLAEAVPAAEKRWEDIDPDSLPDFPAYTRDDVEEARAFLDDLDSRPRTSDTVEEALWRVDDAVGALAYAVALEGSFDVDALYREADETLAAFESLTVDHACADPGRYLPYARRIDHQRWWGQRDADAVVPGGEVRSGADRSTPEGKASLAGQHATAQARLLDVRQYRAVARKQPLGDGSPDGERRPFGEQLTRNVETLVSDLDPLVERFETFEEEHEEYPAAFADGIWTRGMRGRNGVNEGAYRTTEFPAFGAAKVAEGFVHIHAFVDALETLDPESPPDADSVFEEKRTAREALRERLDSNPSPLVRDHLRHAREAVENGDLTLRYFDRHDDVDPARAYTEAWVDYHAARVAASRAGEVESVLTQW